MGKEAVGNTGERPDFSKDMSVAQFDSHYWYLAELKDICRKYGLSASGTKAELTARIRLLLLGEIASDQRQSHTAARKKQELGEITLNTRLIPDGFKFNQQARQFFAAYYGKQTFSFTKEMAAALRDAERRGDHDMTVADLLDIYEGKKIITNPDERSYQWNQFVKDFNSDPLSQHIAKNRMKVAAALWRKVRDNPGDKRYSSALLQEYLHEADLTDMDS
ncbi:SAP domain-containing protein [Paenibacillus senegalensis]|uniref:SAP domain-containing protein n=1 Tax=Paenibacillus senegalensis TaxID=1465766 RepID=UPI00028A0D4C|nr:SAP domain-containing protein [Paenibacillus senegalensis]